MQKSSCLSFGAKTYYRPIEAAIRWAGLLRFELRILETLGPRAIPETSDFPRWPVLRLFAERIFDALAHDELRFGKAGIAQESQRPALDDPDLIVRHVDLKAWMSYYYPGERPPFLFDEIERELHPAVNLATLNVLLADREATKVQLAELTQLHAASHAQHEALVKEYAIRTAEGDGAREPGLRSESTYLNIIGGLLEFAVRASHPPAHPIHPSTTWAPWSARCWPTMKDGPASVSGRCGASSPKRAATWKHRAEPAAAHCNCSCAFCSCSEFRSGSCMEYEALSYQRRRASRSVSHVFADHRAGLAARALHPAPHRSRGQNRLQTRAHLQPDEGRQVPQGAAPRRARRGLGLGGDRAMDRGSPSTSAPDASSVPVIQPGEAHAGGVHHFDQGRRGQDRRRRPIWAASRPTPGCACCCWIWTCSPRCRAISPLAARAPAGIYEMLAYNEQRAEQLVSHTVIERLDPAPERRPGRAEHAAAARARWKIAAAPPIAHAGAALRPDADRHAGRAQRVAGDGGTGLRPGAVACDARNPSGARIATRHAAAHRGHRAVSAPRHRKPPPLHLLINRVHPVSSNARLIQRALRQFQGQSGVRVLDTDVPAIEAYPRAATRGLPVHRVGEYRQPAGRAAPAVLDTMRALASELFPAWQERFALVNGRGDAGGAGHGQRAELGPRPRGCER